jgi:hypothetical protein
MSVESHLTELERKHKAIERQIDEELAHPNADSLRLAALKRRKLQLKDNISKIKRDVPEPKLH